MKKTTAGTLCQQALLKGIFLSLLLSFFTSCGGGEESSLAPFPSTEEKVEDTQSEESTLQVGPTWDAKIVSKEFLRERNDFLTTKLSENTVKVSTFHNKGTGFYLGKYRGLHIIATSAHVLTNVAGCGLSTVFIQFPLAEKVFTCHQLIGIFADVDFALMAIKSESPFFDNLNPLKLAKEMPLKGAPLLSTGFGNERNSDLNMTLKEDKHCTTFSETDELKRISNQDEQKPRSIPSVAVGCDFSQGDSGSPIIDKEQGEVIGVTWSIMSPKAKLIKSEAYLDQLLSTSDSAVWRNLALAVPAFEIRQSLIRWTNLVSVSLPMRKRRLIVEEILK